VEELPEYVQPVAYKFISEMPLTPVGKVDYRKLEEQISPRDY
jgi:long-chain acyl-CoA synthetase